ncbi:TonB-dependent receptor, partial [candidate division KSB1 bacterium]|nr:TonB-dependent receptor [candidate division KSB1 bacterium]
GYTYINLRGFDQRRISVMINGVPQNDPEDHGVYWLDFPDLAANIENIQVQRGAGSYWSGTPAIGGAINLITSNFTRQRGIAFTSGYGSFNTRKFSLTASSGLLEDKYAIYGRLGKIESDGYRENSWVDFNSYYLGVARFDRNMTTQINLYGGPISDHLAYYGVPKAYLNDRRKRKYNPITRKEEIENFSQPHYELINEWKIGNAIIHNTLFYVKGEGFFDYDGSWASYSYYRITPENGFAVQGDPEELYIPNALIHAFVHNKQWGWMPRAQINHTNGVLTLGGEARLHRSLHYGTLKWGESLPAGVTPDYRYYSYRGGKNMFSLYANEIYRLSHKTRLLTEATLVHHTYRLYEEKYVGNDFRMPYFFFNPKVGVQYHFRPGWHVFTTFARTSREPRLKNLYDAAESSTPVSWGSPVAPQFEQNADGSFDFDRPLVKHETMHDLEAGLAYSDDQAHLSAVFYYMSFRNEIVKSGQLDRFGQPITGNADKTLHRGVELTGRWRFSHHWQLSGNAAWSSNRLVKHTRYTDEGPVVLDNHKIAGFPDIVANARITYRNGGLSLSLAGRHVGSFYTSNMQNPQQKVKSHTLADLNCTFRMTGIPALQGIIWQVSVNNLFDALYAAGGEGDEFFPGATRNVFVGMTVEL